MDLRTKYLTVAAFLVFAILAVLGLKQGASAATGRFRHSVGVGVDFYCPGSSDSYQQSVFGALKIAQTGWVRISFPWTAQLYEPSGAPPGYPDGFDSTDLASFKSCVEQAARAGIKVLVVFQGTPAWALQADGLPDPTAYAAAIGYLAHTFTEVSAWEVWNEENMKSNWPGRPVQYVKLLQAAYPAVKQGNPNALVVFGGTERNGAGWLRRCYRGGAGGFFDAMATHPYPPHKAMNVFGQALSSVSQVRKVMVAYGDAAKPIWFTEFGWSRRMVSPSLQARLLTKSYSFIAAHLRYVQVAIWYDIENPGAKEGSWLAGLSLLTSTGEPTPAYWALAAYDARNASG